MSTRSFSTFQAATLPVSLIALLLLSATVLLAEDKPAAAQKTPQLEETTLGSTYNVHQFGSTLLCGQPNADDFKLAKEAGIQVVITLRKPREVRWDEKETVEKLGMEFHQLSFQAPATLTDNIFDESRLLLKNSTQKPVMLHCGSANRVGAVWAAHRILDQGVEVEAALKEAEEVGLRTKGYIVKVRDYVQRKQAEQKK